MPGAPLIRVGGSGAAGGGVRSSRRAGAMAATTAGAGGSGRGWIATGARRAGSGAWTGCSAAKTVAFESLA